MSKLHEILAVEGELEGAYKKITEEAKATFDKKAAHFMGAVKKYEPFDEALKATESTEDRLEMVSTVRQKLDYMFEHVVRFIDCTAQKDRANQLAKADIIINDKVLVKDVASTTLLGLESRIKQWREVIDSIPTLPPGIAWKLDANIGKDVYRRIHPEEKFRTAKTFKHTVLVAATDKHPAQIEKWQEDINVGKYITESWSGMLTPSEKSEILGRVDTLARAIKEARQRANCQEIEPIKICKPLVNYILGIK